MADEDLKLKIGEPTVLDKALEWSRNKPLIKEELSGFVKAGGKNPDKGLTIRPFVKIQMPDREDGPKGKTVIVGIKGTF